MHVLNVRSFKKQVRLDNVMSGVDILGQFGKLFYEPLDCFPSYFRPFYPTIGSLKKKKRVTDGRTDGQTLL